MGACVYSWFSDQNEGFSAIASFITIAFAIWAIPTALVKIYRFLKRPKHTLLADMSDPNRWHLATERLKHLAGTQDVSHAVAHANDRPQTAFRAYQTRLNRLLSFTDAQFGGVFSPKSFFRCLTLAYLYPIVSALLTWTVTGTGTLGGVEISTASDLTSIGRVLRLVALFILWGMAFYIVENANRFSIWTKEKFTPISVWLDPWDGFLAKASRGSVEFFAFMTAVALAGALAGISIVAASFTSIPASAFAITAAFVIPGTFGANLAFAFTSTSVAVFAVVFEESSILFFFILLPLTNAVADFLSLSVTRLFLKKIAQEKGAGTRWFWEILIDIVVAVCCLFGLVIGICALLDLWPTLLPDRFALPFDWRLYRAEVLDNWQHGVMLYTMAATTLVPTLIHVTLGAWAIALHRPKMAAELIEKMRGLEARGIASWDKVRQADEITPLKSRLHKAYFGGITGAALAAFSVTAVFALLIWLGMVLLAASRIEPFAM